MAFATRALEVTDMADMEGIKTSVGKNYAEAVTFFFDEDFAKRFTADDLAVRLAHKLRSASPGFAAKGVEEFFAGNRGCAALHHYQATGNIRNVRGFQSGSATSKGQRICGKNGVSGSGDIDGLVAAMNGNVRDAGARFKERHAVVAARHEQRADFHFRQRGSAAAGEFLEILTDHRVMQRFEFGFIRRGRGNSGFGEGVKLIARIERDRKRALALCAG